MRITNQSKNTILAENAQIAEGLFQRMKGLLGRRVFAPGDGLLIRPCNSVHTFFMRFAIDVLFLDKNNRVVKSISGLPPFRVTAVCIQAKSVVELPCGVIQSCRAKAGDTILLDRPGSRNAFPL